MMDDEQYLGAVQAALADAADFIDGTIADQRGRATAYYRGDPFGPGSPGAEEPGRSQIVMTEVRDTVLAMMPGLLRIFTSSDQAVSFEPRRKENVEMAEQATDACNYVLLQRQRWLLDPLRRLQRRFGAQVGHHQVALGRRHQHRGIPLREL